jgi:demethylmenaquinone methyltransferase/2-methoxy-6-polyprenyl-1,4-benzoquinol methylase
MSIDVKPYSDSDKSRKEQITEMFDSIAPSYDFLNHFLSLGIDILWRRKAIRMLKMQSPERVLDIATGTGDFAIEAMRMKPKEVIGLDISPGMLEVGRTKMKKKGLENLIRMELGESEKLPYPEAFADAITVGFGARNFENLEKGLSEMHRVLKPGGRAVILEPSFPRSFPMKQLFGFYFQYVLPLLGRLFSKDSHAYTYLPASVAAFPEGKDFLEICRQAGFQKTSWHPLTFGICALYLLEK